jgi:hypothetical protein
MVRSRRGALERVDERGRHMVVVDDWAWVHSTSQSSVVARLSD